MTKKALLTAVATAVVAGGVTLSTALYQIRTDMGATCGQLQTRLAADRKPITWFVALASGFVPPEAFRLDDDYRVIGAIEGSGASGQLVLRDESCGEDSGYSYRYWRATEGAGWRVYRMHGDAYFARSWQLGADLTNDVRWLGSWSGVVEACLSHFTAPQCKAALGQVSACWRYPDGSLCRSYEAATQLGLRYGPGLGGVDRDGNPVTCTITAEARPIPCGDNGEGPGYVERIVAEDPDISMEAIAKPINSRKVVDR